MRVLARHWWLFAIRGVLGIVFGLIAFFWPAVTLYSLVYVFAAYAVADGLFAIVAAMRASQHHERWTPFLLEGVVGVVAGVAAFLWPPAAVWAFVMLVAAWAILSGALMLSAAFRVGMDHGRWWFALGGIASLIYGALLVFAPMIGAIVLTWWIGAYALVFGTAMLAGSLRLRAHA
jgi:uncharacterized membrane protein HdeD (DUF308 family)